MRLEEVLPAYRAGKKVKRKSWARILCSWQEIRDEDLSACDWEIVEEPITITREQFERVWWKVCPERHPATMDKIWEELKK